MIFELRIWELEREKFESWDSRSFARRRLVGRAAAREIWVLGAPFRAIAGFEERCNGVTICRKLDKIILAALHNYQAQISVRP
jgi:hypothetical protein